MNNFKEISSFLLKYFSKIKMEKINIFKYIKNNFLN
jgi:hypothetical protein